MEIIFVEIFPLNIFVVFILNHLIKYKKLPMIYLYGILSLPETTVPRRALAPLTRCGVLESLREDSSPKKA